MTAVPTLPSAEPDYEAMLDATLRRAKEVGTPEAVEWLDELDRMSRDGSMANIPSVREQLAEYRRRRGLA